MTQMHQDKQTNTLRPRQERTDTPRSLANEINCNLLHLPKKILTTKILTNQIPEEYTASNQNQVNVDRSTLWVKSNSAL